MSNISENPTSESPLVSVIVTTRNEEKNIENCLKSIQAQTYLLDQIEIVVVDNASTDNTKAIARKYTDHVFDCGPERAAQRNYGVRKAKGEYVLYLDADMTLSDGVILMCVREMQQNLEVVGLYVSEVVTGDRFFSRVRWFERTFYDGTVIDCARFISRELFLELEGFDETITGPEDWDFDKRLRGMGRVGLVCEPIYHNEEEFELKKYLVKKGYYATNFDDYIAKWGRSDPDIQRQFGVWYRYFLVFFENGKWKRIFSNPVLSLGMFFLRILVGFVFLKRKWSSSLFNPYEG